MIDWLSGFYFLIRSSPQIFTTLLELKKLWDAYLVHEQKERAMLLLGAAINAARTEHNTSKLTDLVNNIIAGRLPDDRPSS